MHEIGLFEAKNRLSELVGKAEKGEEIIITRRGKPAARLVSLAGEKDRSRAMAAVERIIALRNEFTLGDDVTIKELIEDGRK